MKKTLLFSIVILISMNLKAQKDKSFANDTKIDQLIADLTLEEKAALCSGRDDWSTTPIERLDIPWIWMSDGPHGLRRAPATNKAGYGDQLPATCFPTASALAATWDLDLVKRVGQTIGKECQALNVNILLGPGVNIKRSILGGRNFEYFSEDPRLSGEMGAAFINGVQSTGVGTSLKHFTANNVETMRMYMNSDVDSRTLHEIYLAPFEIAVKKAQPWTIMACYNRVQGKYGTQNPELLTDILRKDWGFKGVVISDWFAVVNRTEALRSGLNIEMPFVSAVNDSLLVKSVKNGELDESILDQRVKSILKIVLKAKSLEKEDASFDQAEHHQFARKVAAEAATLLKNDGDVLPLSDKKYKKIAVIGQFATSPRFQGNGSSEVKPTILDNILDLMEKEYGNKYGIEYAQGYSLNNDHDLSMIERAKEKASEADIALIFAGLPLHYESEGIDRKHINLPESHNKLISEVAGIQKNTAVILTNGSAVAMPWVNEVPCILETWLGGQAGAGGTVDVLFGNVNPSGKLAESFPKKLEDTPAFLNFPGEDGEVLYGERMFIGYRYYDKKKIDLLFPFGHGLSYTHFEYSDMKVSTMDFSEKEKVKVSFKLKNTGKVTGKEIVQLYVQDVESTLQRPEKELKGFQKIELKPGEETVLNFELNKRDFAYYDSRREQWVVESGDFILHLGSSARDIRLSEKIYLTSMQELALAFDEFTFFIEYWNNSETREFLKELVPNWIGQFVPEGMTMDDADFQAFLVEHPLIKYPYITNGEISHDQVKELVKKCAGLTYRP